MFDSLIETTRHLPMRRCPWTQPLSLIAHLCLVGLALSLSAVATQVVQQRPPIIDLVTHVLPGPQPAASSPAAAARGAAQEFERPSEPDLPIVQPHRLPDVVPETSSAAGREQGTEGGLDSGFDYGPPGGVLGDGPGGGTSAFADPLGDPSTPIVPGPGVTLPELLHKVEPDYPEIARRVRLPGKVVCQAVISESGRVEEVTVLHASNELFVDASVAAIREWTYRPALQNGRPITVYFTIVVEFEIR